MDAYASFPPANLNVSLKVSLLILDTYLFRPEVSFVFAVE